MDDPLDVIGVGDVDVDIFIRLPHRPGPDEKVVATEVRKCPGGMIGNFLVALASFGTRCGIIGVVGDDADGRLIRANLEQRRVCTHALRTHPHAATFTCVIMIDADGEKSLILLPTDAFWPDMEDVTPARLARARHLHTTADRPVIAAAALALAHELGLQTSLDLEVGKFADEPIDWSDLLTHTDILFTNRRSCRLLTGSDDVWRAVHLLRHKGPDCVAVTCGAAGAVLCDETGIISLPAKPAAAVDTTGAGDRFAAALLHARLQAWPSDRQLQFALLHASRAVEDLGGEAGLYLSSD